LAILPQRGSGGYFAPAAHLNRGRQQHRNKLPPRLYFFQRPPPLFTAGLSAVLLPRRRIRDLPDKTPRGCYSGAGKKLPAGRKPTGNKGRGV